MGRKCFRTRKLIYILAACIVFLLSGCAAPKTSVEKRPNRAEPLVSHNAPERIHPMREEKKQEIPPKGEEIASRKIRTEEPPFHEVQSMRGADEAKRKRAEEALHLRENTRLKATTKHLALAKKLLDQGDYESSLKESQRVLTLSGKNTPGDEALFTMGLTYIHYKNPRKDYEKSRVLFEKLMKEYPQSPLVEQTKIWVDVLQVIEKLKKVDMEIEEKKKELSK